MPVDTSFYSQIGRPAVQLDDPVNRLAQLGQFQGMQNQNRLAQLQINQATQADSDRNALSGAYREAYNPQTGQLDNTKLIGNLANAGAGAAIPGAQKAIAESQKAQREAEKATLEQAINKQALVSQYAGSATDQASWTAARNAVAQLGINVDQVPEQFDPAVAKQLQQRALTGVQQLDQHWKQQGYDLDVRKQNETERNNKAQNSVAQGNLGVAQGQLGVARAGLDIKRQELAQGKVPQGYRANADGTLSAIPGGPADIKNSKEGAQRTQDAQDVLSIAEEAKKLLPNASNGYLSQGANMAAGALGISTNAAQTDARLKVLQGAMVSKMPKMSGPQSDKDVLLYREMAGQIGDPSVPVKQRLAALDTVISLQNKYLGNGAPAAAQQPSSSDGWSVTQVK